MRRSIRSTKSLIQVAPLLLALTYSIAVHRTMAFVPPHQHYPSAMTKDIHGTCTTTHESTRRTSKSSTSGMTQRRPQQTLHAFVSSLETEASAVTSTHNSFTNIIDLSQHNTHHNSLLDISIEPSTFSLSTLSSPLSSLILSDANSNKEDIAFEDAFNDNIQLFNDSTIQLLFVGFTILILFSILIKSILTQMDDAIEKVLVDFETVMTRNEKYRGKWKEIEEQLQQVQRKGLEGSNNNGSGTGNDLERMQKQRMQKLFEIMEDLQQNDPEFMEKVNNDMMKL